MRVLGRTTCTSSLSIGLLALLSSLLSPVLASFHRDVLMKNHNKPQPSQQAQWKQQEQQQREALMHNELLQKAMPRKAFEAKYGVSLDGATVVNEQQQQQPRFLEEENNNGDGDGDDDDYYMNYNYMYSFSGYSMKFAKCQPVQYFSENALAAGEHSPMVTDDIVILRLCPTSSCSSEKEYGCQYNFSEYAIELGDYVRIMLRYSAQKRDYMCDYCATCLANGNGNDDYNQRRGRRYGRTRRLEDGGEGDQDGEEGEGDQEEQQDGGDEQQDGGDEQQGYDNQQQGGDDGYYNGGGDDGAAYYYQDEEDNGDDYYLYACDTWSTYCTDYSEYCVDQEEEDNENNNNNQNYIDFEDYLDYLDCSEVKYNDYAYFVRPRCDGYQETIKMAVYYDNYCVQYAGNEVSLKNLGLGFKESAFQDFYSGECLDCSESEYPPYDASSTLCNRLHADSAKCTDDMEYDLFGGVESSQTECSYIESLRFGTYNELGQLSTKNSDGTLVSEMTQGQKAMLGMAIAVCVALVVYACYLHHAMTNLLIKSLSHRELLPPSRHAQQATLNNYNSSQGGGSGRRTSPRRTGRRLKKVGGEPDWDEHHTNEGEYA